MTDRIYECKEIFTYIEAIILGKEINEDLEKVFPNEHVFFSKLSALFKEKELKRIKRYRNVVGYYAKMIVQFIEICSSHGITGWHKYKCFEGEERDNEGEKVTLLQLIKASVPFYKSHYNRQLAFAINEVVKAWDDVLRVRHEVTPNHCVFMLYSDTNQGKALMFHYEEEPDTRLIIIFVMKNGSYRNRLLICLHELGHYIGCRKRQNRCELYLLLSAMSFLEMVYRKGWAKFLCVEEENIIPNSTGNITYSSQLRNELLNSRDLIGSCSMDIFELLKREIIPLGSPQKVYMKSMHELVMDALDSNLDAVVKIIMDRFVKSKGVGTKCYQEFGKAAKEIIALQRKDDSPKNATGYEADKEYNILAQIVEKCSFLDRVDILFSEIAADIFMIRAGGINKKKAYFQLILNETIKQWKNEIRKKDLSKEQFINFTLSDLFRIRVMSILHAIPQNSGLVGWRRKKDWISDIAKKFAQLDTLYQNADGKLREKSYKCELSHFDYKFYPEQDIWNPQRAFSAYAKKIFADGLYQATCDSHLTKEGNETSKKTSEEQNVRESIIVLRTFLTDNTFTWYCERLIKFLRS